MMDLEQSMRVTVYFAVSAAFLAGSVIAALVVAFLMW